VFIENLLSDSLSRDLTGGFSGTKGRVSSRIADDQAADAVWFLLNENPSTVAVVAISKILILRSSFDVSTLP